MRGCTLVFFARYPEPGRVKTRLARTLGPGKAAERYRELVESNLQTLLPLLQEGVEIVISFDPPAKEKEIKRWLPGPYHYLPQPEGDLGTRLLHAFQTIFQAGAKKGMALASDTVGLQPSFLQQGFDCLEASDVVIGPAQDGGYYLIGLKKVEPFLFQKIPWSSSEVFKTTLDRIREGKLTYALLPVLEDLDEVKREEMVFHEPH